MPNRTVIVSDSNVFVFLIRSNTFETVFHKTRIKIVVPSAVVDEIKNGLISRKYPDVTDRFNKALHSPLDNDEVDLNELSIDEIQAEAAINYYHTLDDFSELYRGEIECLALSMEYQFKFLSDDEDAVNECKRAQLSGEKFDMYIEKLKEENIITNTQYQAILLRIKE